MQSRQIAAERHLYRTSQNIAPTARLTTANEPICHRQATVSRTSRYDRRKIITHSEERSFRLTRYGTKLVKCGTVKDIHYTYTYFPQLHACRSNPDRTIVRRKIKYIPNVILERTLNASLRNSLKCG